MSDVRNEHQYILDTSSKILDLLQGRSSEEGAKILKCSLTALGIRLEDWGM